MFQKTFTILSLIGLLLSVGLWGVSCFNFEFEQTASYLAGEDPGVKFVTYDTIWLTGGSFCCELESFKEVHLKPDGYAFVTLQALASPTEPEPQMSLEARAVNTDWSWWVPTYARPQTSWRFVWSTWLPSWDSKSESKPAPSDSDVVIKLDRLRVLIPLYLPALLFGYFTTFLLFPGSCTRKLRWCVGACSLVGLLLSSGLWIASYWNLRCSRTKDMLIIESGCLTWTHTDWNSGNPYISFGFYRNRKTTWIPRPEPLSKSVWRQPWSTPVTKPYPVLFFDTSLAGARRLILPLWMPTLSCFCVFCFSCVPGYRRRKCKKLGLCLNCGYDLRGSKERCPECGDEFQESERSVSTLDVS